MVGYEVTRHCSVCDKDVTVFDQTSAVVIFDGDTSKRYESGIMKCPTCQTNLLAEDEASIKEAIASGKRFTAILN